MSATFPHDAATVIIGAGITGLCLARRLAAEGRSVVVLEAAGAPGGLLAPKLLRGVPVDAYYHHLFVSDGQTRRLLANLGMEDALVWRTTSVALLNADGFHALTTPLDVVRFRGLSFGDKARLALLVQRARSVRLSSLDHILARDWATSLAGKEAWEGFLTPLVEAKFGAAAPSVSAAWLAGRIGCRSTRTLSGERLGYLASGFHTLIGRLVRDVESSLWCSDPATGLVVEAGRIVGVSVGAHTITCRDAVFTGGANALARLLGDQAPSLLPGLSSLAFQGIVCGIFVVDAPARGAYWTNVTAPGAPFNVVVQQDLLVPLDGVRGVVYVSRYAEPETVSAMDADQELDAFQHGLRTFFGIDPATVVDRALASTDDAGIIYTTGTHAAINNLRPAVSGFHVAGMLTSFPDRSIEQSVASALDARFHCS